MRRGAAVSEQWQEDESSPRNYEREQADLERQTDALVLKTLTSLVSAAEDMKARLRRDTDSLLEEFRRTKRGLENDISMAGAERQRLRDEAESERDRILNEARSEAERVVREAQQERESLLGEVRESQERLRALEAQILQVLGAARGGGVAAGPAATEQRTAATAPLGQSMPGAAGVAPGVTTTPSPSLGGPAPASSAPVSETLTPPAGTPSPSAEARDDLATSGSRVDTTRLGEPEPADHLEATTTTFDAPTTEPTRPAASVSAPTPSALPVTARADEPELSFASTAAPDPTAPTATPPTRTDEMVEVPAATAAASAPPPVAEPSAVTSSSVPTTPPAAGPTPEAAETTGADAAPAARPLQLVFDGVPGYQQAAAIERAVGDLVDDSEVEIIEFEQGQLVLQIEATDPRALADRLMARPPLPMRLVASGQDSATFQLTAG